MLSCQLTMIEQLGQAFDRTIRHDLPQYHINTHQELPKANEINTHCMKLWVQRQLLRGISIYLVYFFDTYIM